jgi:hypothetical protein
MSFLEADDPLEADGALKAALVFLDEYAGVQEDEGVFNCLGLTTASSCGSPPRGTPSDLPRSSSTDSTQGAGDGDAPSSRHSSLVESSQGKIKRSNASAAMRLRRKRKAERLLLREQAAQLEALIRRLRQAREPSRTQRKLAASHRIATASAVETVDIGGFVQWRDMATQIQRERQQAEVENIQLREILAKQFKLAQSLKGLLQKRGVFQVDGAALSLWWLMPVVLTMRFVAPTAGNRPRVRTPAGDATTRPVCQLRHQVDAGRHGGEDPEVVCRHWLGVFVGA